MPPPETPVTQVKVPSGKPAVMDFRLLARAFTTLTTRSSCIGRRSSGTSMRRVFAVNLVLVPFVLNVIGSLVSQSGYGYGIANNIYWLWPLVLVGELVAGLVLLRGPRDELGRSFMFAVLFSFVIPIVLGVLLFGLCLILAIGGALLYR